MKRGILLRKKYIALFLVITLMLLLSGCFGIGKSGKQNTTKKTEDDTPVYADLDLNADKEKISKYYTPVDITFGYDNLFTDDQREFYNKIAECVEQVSDEQNEDGVYPCTMVNLEQKVLTQSEIRYVISAYKSDHPLVFWLTENFGYTNTDGYTALQLYSYESPQTITSMQGKLIVKINQFIDSTKEGMDIFSLEKLAHDMIIDNCEYADNVKSADDDYLAFTAYGALVNGSAVCEGYAKAFIYLNSRVGINGCTIMGKGSKELHMWNAVELNGEWYYVDLSWDDSKAYSRYDYFNITTDQLSADHVVSDVYSNYSKDEICGENGKSAVNFNIVVPECSATEYNYYYKTASHFDDLYNYYDEDIINALYNAADNGNKYIHIYIDPIYLEFSNATEQLFSSGDQLFFTYIDYANGMHPQNTIDKANIYIIKKENLSVVTVKLSYYN